VEPLVRVEWQGPVAGLTLNRPGRHNSLVPELLGALLEALGALRDRPDLRALVLQAEGRSFSTGGDVRRFYAQGEGIGEYADGLVGQLNRAVLALLDFPAPVVAAVHGIVTGGSLGLVLAADVVLVAPEASFAPWYNVVGFSPDGGWTALLPAVIGPRRAAEVLLRNLTITAQQAVEWGLASRMVPASAVRAEAWRVAAEIAALWPGSVRRTRRLLRGTLGDVAARLEAERREFCAQVVTAEAREGMRRYLGEE